MTTSTATLIRPDCTECDQALEPAGQAVHPYWTCRYCGETVSRTLEIQP